MAPSFSESGLALLPVLAAVATLTLLVTLLLTSSLAAHETAVFARDREQARALARAILDQTLAAAVAGQLPRPAGTVAVEILNGDVVAGAPPRSLPVARFPRPPIRDWPPRTGQPAVDPGAVGVGGRVRLRPVVDTDGVPREVDGAALVEAIAEAWWRRGRAEVRGRFLLGDGSAERLE